MKDQAVRLVFGLRSVRGTTPGTLAQTEDQAGYGWECQLDLAPPRWLAQAEVDAWDVNESKCQAALRDALRARIGRRRCVEAVHHLVDPCV